MNQSEELYQRYNQLPTDELEDILFDIEISASLTLGMNVTVERMHKTVLRRILQERGVDISKIS